MGFVFEIYTCTYPVFRGDIDGMERFVQAGTIKGGAELSESTAEKTQQKLLRESTPILVM